MLDYKQTSDGDIDFSNGDLAITESTGQHQRDLMMADKGHVRNAPQAGVGTIDYVHDSSNDTDDYLRKVSMEFSADGMSVKKLETNASGNLIIDAEYENS